MPSDQKHDFFLCLQPSSSLDHGGVGTGVFPQEIQQILNQTKHISPPTTGGVGGGRSAVLGPGLNYGKVLGGRT